MAKRSSNVDEIRSSLLEADREIFVEESEFTVLEPEYEWIRSVVPQKMIVGGCPSGSTYVFEHGIEVKVRGEDAQYLLSKKRGGCCGGNPYSLFEMA